MLDYHNLADGRALLASLVSARVRAVIGQHLCSDTRLILADTALRSELYADDLDLAELFQAVENEFDVMISGPRRGLINNIVDIENCVVDALAGATNQLEPLTFPECAPIVKQAAVRSGAFRVTRDLKTEVVGTGLYVPSEVITNNDLCTGLDIDEDWILRRTGVRERRRAPAGCPTSFLALEASKRALEMAGLTALELSLIIVATATPDMLSPSTGVILQGKLCASNAAAFDVAGTCSGFIYALAIADAMLADGEVGLIVAAEEMTRVVDYQDPRTAVLFGDGAGAMVVRRSGNASGILSTHLRSDGTFRDAVRIPAGGTALPTSLETIRTRQHYLKMNSRVFKLAVHSMAQAARDAMQYNGLDLAEVDVFVTHQANARIILATAELLKIPESKLVMNVERYGNTSSASIPIALDEAYRSGRIKKGKLVLLVAFGAGFTWASALVRW